MSENKQMLYLKTVAISLVVSVMVVVSIGGIFFSKKQMSLNSGERISRLELELEIQKIISPFQKCNAALKGLKVPSNTEFTDMENLSYTNGRLALESNSETKSLYVEQIRLQNLSDSDSDSRSKTLIEISVPLRSKRDRSIELETIKVRVYVEKDSVNRVAECRD